MTLRVRKPMSPSIINSTLFYPIAIYLFRRFPNMFFLFVGLFVFVFIFLCSFLLMLLLLYTFFPRRFLLLIYIKKGYSSPFYLSHILIFCPKLY